MYTRFNFLFLSLMFLGLKLYSQDSFMDPSVDTLKLDEVIVTGTKTTSSRDFVPISLSVVDQDLIVNNNSSTAFQAISELSPGVFLTQRGIGGYGIANGSAGKLNIRGLSSGENQILVLIDGNPQFMGLMGHPMPDSYTLNDVKQLEVLRGPASMLYGSNAVGGVVNIITKKQVKKGHAGNLGFQYGMYNSLRANASYGYRGNRFNAFLSFNHEQTDNHRDSAGFNMQNAMAKIVYNFNQNLSFNVTSNLTSYLSADPGPKGGMAGDTADVLRTRVSVALNNNYENFSGGFTAYYNNGDHKISDGWASTDEMWGLSIYETARLFKGNEFTFGYDLMDYGGVGSPIVNVVRDDNGNIIPNNMGFPQIFLSPYNNIWLNHQEQAVYAAMQQELFSHLVLSGGVRYSMHKTFGNEWVPQFGLVYNINHNSKINAVVSKGYRNPSIKELYFFPTANEDLNPEKLMNYELSWRQLWLDRKFKTEFGVFYAHGDNLIVQEVNVPGQPPQYRNSGDFANRGIEFSSVYQPMEDLSLLLNYAYLNMDNPLPGSPEHNLNFSANYTINRWHLNLNFQNISNLYATVNNKIDVIASNYSLMGVKLLYQLNEYVKFNFNGNNLFDTKYEINSAYPMPGINLHVGVQINL